MKIIKLILSLVFLLSNHVFSEETGVSRSKYAPGAFYHMGQFFSPDTDQHCKAIVKKKYLLSNKDLIDCFRPDLLETNFVDRSEVVENDLNKFRHKLEMWLYFMNASDLIIDTANRRRKDINRLNELAKANEWDNPDIPDLREQSELFGTLAVAQKLLNAYRHLERSCKRKRVTPICKIVKDPDYEQAKHSLQQTATAISMNNPMFSDRKLQDALRKYAKVNRRTLDKAKGISIDASAIEEEFKKLAPEVLSLALTSLDETIDRHRPIVEKKIPFGDVDEVLKNDRIMIDYDAANYRPGDTYIQDASGQMKAVNLNYASCKIWLQKSVNELADTRTSLYFDVALVAASFGASGLATMVVRGARTASHATRVSKGAKAGLWTSEVGIGGAEAKRVLGKVKKCKKIVDQGLGMVKFSASFQEIYDECQTSINRAVQMLGLAAIGGAVGAKFANYDIIAGRLRRVKQQRGELFKKAQAKSKAAKVSQQKSSSPLQQTALNVINSREASKQMSEEVIDSISTFNSIKHSEFNTEVKFLTDSRTAYLTKIKLIRQAKSTIDLNYYIFSPDKAGYALLEELRKAVKRGVEVRIMVDSLGSLKGGPFHEELKALTRVKGGFIRNSDGTLSNKRATAQAVIFNPILNIRTNIKNLFIRTQNIARRLQGKKPKQTVDFVFDRRVHDKIFIVDANDYDNAYAIIGGRNISEEDIGIQQHDIEVLIKNPKNDVREGLEENIGEHYDPVKGIEHYYNKLFYYQANKNLATSSFFSINPKNFRQELKRFREAQKKLFRKGENTQEVLRDMDKRDFLKTGFTNVATRLLNEIHNITRKHPVLGPSLKNPVKHYNRNSIVDSFVKDLKIAQNTIEIASPYLHFSPREIKMLHKWLNESPHRRLKIVTNSIISNDHIIPQAHFDYYVAPQLLKNFENSDQIEIYNYGKARNIDDGDAKKPGLLHAKIYMIDSKVAFVGTSNLDNRSRLFNSEVGLRLNAGSNPEKIIELKKHLHSFYEHSYVYGSDEWISLHNDPKHKAVVLLEKMAFNLMRLLVYPLPHFR